MNFFQELKRRNVIQVALLYLVAGWLILQVADVLFGNLGAPEWAFRLVLGLLVLFFVPVLIFAWVFEVTPEGIQRDSRGENDPSVAGKSGRRSMQLALALLFVMIAVTAVDRLFPASSQSIPLKSVDDTLTAESTLTIAVLPFAVIGSDPDQEYLADGLAEELTHVLSDATDLRVIGRTSSFEFKNRSDDLRAIGERLGAAYILEGSLRKAGDTLRISSQLIDASDGVQVWSETYERDWRDFFAIQDSIARAVVAALEVEFLGIVRGSEYDSDAYDLYLRGLHAARILSPEGQQEALEYFRRSTELDPSLAPAWRQLAKVYSRNTLFWAMDADESAKRITAAVDEALALEPDSAEAYAILGSMRMTLELDWRGAEEAFRRAYKLDPDDPATLRALGALAAAHGNIRKAIDYTRRNQRVDPLDIAAFHNEGFYLYLDRDFVGASEAYRRARTLAGGAYAVGQGMLAMALLSLNRPEDALEEVREEPVEPLRIGVESLVYQALGDQAVADERLSSLEERFGSRAAVPIAGTYAQRGEFDKAFEWLERAYEQRDPQLLWTLLHPINEPLKADPRFEKFLDALELSPDS